MKRKNIIFTGIALLILYLAWVVPIPYYLETPGGAFLIDDMIEMEGADTRDNGAYSLTTIAIRQATPITALSALLPYVELIPEEKLFSDVDKEMYDIIQDLYMENSIQSAIQAAFEAADAKYERNYAGVYVLEVIEDSDFFGQLKTGDTIKQIDNQSFEHSQAFIDYILSQEVDDRVVLEIEREGEILEFSGKLIEHEDGRPAIGIRLVDDSEIYTDPAVYIDAGDIGGPSAGLMYTLQIYDLLVPEDINQDLHISGSGTISPDGSVGQIGGVDKKVIAADQAGADIFFAPDMEVDPEFQALYPEYLSNYEVAKIVAEDIGTDMVIVPVKTFEEALNYLNQLREERN